MSPQSSILLAHSTALDPRQAVAEFHAAVAQPHIALVIFFCSSAAYDLAALAAEINRRFAGVQVVGCTTAGEIGPAGYRENSLCGASFATADFTAVSGCIEHLQQFDTSAGQGFAQDLLRQLEHAVPAVKPGRVFALQLIDGLSVREEPVTRSFQSALWQLPVVGGSAGDGLNFRRTLVFADGAFHPDSAVLLLIHTELPFKPFKTQHFVPTNERAVVTQADAARRIVTEIDGLPAVDGYARLLGLAPGDLDPVRIAASPMVVMIDGTNYVRSVQKANPEGSLTFFCAIEEGLTLRLACGVDLVENLEQAFNTLRAQLGPPQLVIGFDCILRRLEIVRSGLEQRVAAVLTRNHTIGFNTYGEQLNGLHINQTLTGIAIGDSRLRSDA